MALLFDGHRLAKPDAQSIRRCHVLAYLCLDSARGVSMTRKRNINFGFLPAHPTRADLAKSRRAFKARVREKVREQRAHYSRLGKSARAAFPGKKKLESLFHEVYGQNPRTLPAVTDEQLAAFENLIKGKSMPKKRKSKKKNSRKGKMPAGLKAYWARKRAAKAKRRNPRKKRATRTRRAKTRTRTIIKYRTRTVKVYPKRRRRKSNPRRKLRTTIRIKAPAGLGPKGLRQFRAMAAKAYGVPARIVKR